MKKNTKYTNMGKENLFVYILAIALMVIGLTAFNNYVWNDGKCTDCDNGNYVFVNADYEAKTLTHYYYSCDNCGHTIEIFTRY